MTLASTSIRVDCDAAIEKSLKFVVRHRKQLPDSSMLVRLARFWWWLQYSQCIIRDVHEKMVPLHPNRGQRMVIAAMFLQALRNKPIRLSILKARKIGVTTLIEAWFYFNCRFYASQGARMLAHAREATHDIFEIAQRVGESDLLSPPHPTRSNLVFSSRSRFTAQTAAGENVGAGGTPNLLHRSELALWQQSKKKENDYVSGNAVPDTPTSCILDESTARGRELFFNRFEAAHDSEHPFDPVFIPWFIDDRLEAEVASTLTYTDDELMAIASAMTWGVDLTPEAIQWRRNKIAVIGVDLFRQEYPTSPEEAIQGMQGLVVPGLRGCIVDSVPFAYDGLGDEYKVGGWDYGYNDPSACINGVVWDGVLYVLGCEAESGLLAEGMPNALGIMPGHHYHCDPSALGPRNELQAVCNSIQLKATFGPAPRGRGKAGEIQVADEWDRVRRYIAQGKLRILDSAADGLVYEADNLFYNAKTGKPDKIRLDGASHFDRLDALRYMVCGVTLSNTAAKPKARRRQATRREMLRR